MIQKCTQGKTAVVMVLSTIFLLSISAGPAFAQSGFHGMTTKITYRAQGATAASDVLKEKKVSVERTFTFNPNANILMNFGDKGEVYFATDNPNGDIATMTFVLQDPIELPAELLHSIEAVGGKEMVDTISQELAAINEQRKIVTPVKVGDKANYVFAEGFAITDGRAAIGFEGDTEQNEESGAAQGETLGNLLFVWPLSPDKTSLDGINLQYGTTPIYLTMSPLGNTINTDKPTYSDSSAKIVPGFVDQAGDAGRLRAVLKYKKLEAVEEEGPDVQSLLNELVYYEYSDSGELLAVRPNGFAADEIKRIGYDAVEPLIQGLREEKEDVKKYLIVFLLYDITQEDFGDDAEKWQMWWDEKKSAPATGANRPLEEIRETIVESE